MEQININMSSYNKMLKFFVGQVEYDISDRVPEDVWNIGNREFPLNPIADWQMRTKLRDIFIKYFKENIDKELDEDCVVF
jgi:hypothetical protein